MEETPARPTRAMASFRCHEWLRSDTVPAKSRLCWFSLLDLLHTAAGKNRAIETSALDVPQRISVLVATFDKQPIISSARIHGSISGFDQREAAAQSFALQYNLDFAASQLLLWRLIFQWLKLSQVPDHHDPCSVLVGRDHAFELRIFERMVLRPHGQALVRRAHCRAFWYCPGRQDPICGDPEIIVKPAGNVFLNHKDVGASASPHSPDRFGRFRKGPFASICCERHLSSFRLIWTSAGGIGDFASSHISPRARHAPAACHPAGREIEGVLAYLLPSTR